MWTLYSLVSKRVISPTPDSPATSRRQKVSTSLPSGEMTPRPVTTTLLSCASARSKGLPSDPQAAVDGQDDAGDEARRRRGQVDHGRGHIVGGADALERCRVDDHLPRLFGKRLRHRRVDIAGSDGVDAHAARAELLG